jgi:hypothetical protein
LKDKGKLVKEYVDRIKPSIQFTQKIIEEEIIAEEKLMVIV